MINKSNFSELNKTLSDSWREQGSLIKYFYEKEDYESLARYKNADFQRIEFEKDNDYTEIKNHAESAKEEISRLDVILQKLDLDLKRIYERRNLFQKELKKLGIDLL
jgi:hypothetical protein